MISLRRFSQNIGCIFILICIIFIILSLLIIHTPKKTSIEYKTFDKISLA